jgi:hypothetical protein
VLASLRRVHFGYVQVEELVRSLLDQLRERPLEAQGYGPANLVALLHLLRGDLCGLDLSLLAIRGASLQGAEMQDADLSGATLQSCVFTEIFDAISAVAISPNGQYWAATSRREGVRLWEVGGQTLYRLWRAHMDRIRALTFSPDGRQLATGSWDNTAKLWDVESGALLWSDWKASSIPSVAFTPDGSLLATSGGNVAMIHLCDRLESERAAARQWRLRWTHPRVGNTEHKVSHLHPDLPRAYELGHGTGLCP